jgi:serine/threonine-protein kinase RsbT
MSEAEGPVPSIALRIDDGSDLATIQVRMGAWLRAHKLSAVDAAKTLTACMELASNVVKFARSGELRGTIVTFGRQRAIEIEAEDHGPGIADVALAMRDRYSSAGTLGLGLPGVRRLMEDFDLRTEVGVGTRVRVRKWLP